MEDNVVGKLALVTGASGGCGKAISHRLADLGLNLALSYHSNPEPCQELASQIAAKHPNLTIKIYKADLSSSDECNTLISSIEKDFNAHIDVLIANAGRGVRQTIDTCSIEEFEKTHAVNLKAPFILSKLTLPHMRAQKWGRIVFVGSVAGFTGGSVGPHYASSKSGLGGLCHWIANNCAKEGITANTVAPALIEFTTMLPGASEELRKRVPVGRLGHPDEVGRLVALMVTTGYLTNQTVLLDGGMYPT